jgi:hypothetical protein
MKTHPSDNVPSGHGADVYDQCVASTEQVRVEQSAVLCFQSQVMNQCRVKHTEEQASSQSVTEDFPRIEGSSEARPSLYWMAERI